MKSVVALALVLACGAPRPRVLPHDPVAVVPAGGVTAGVTPPLIAPVPVTMVSNGPPRASVEAPHAGLIQTLALTPDGTAAITVDQLGGVRLWPTLDGSREPRVVDLQEPRELAIGPRAAGGGFTVLALDQVGGLTIANLDPDGRTTAHRTLAGDPAFVGIATTDHGPLVWRADATIAIYGDDGAVVSSLAVEPGQRLASVSVSGSHAVAVVEVLDGDKLVKRVRELVVTAKLAWGAWLDASVEVEEGEVAISSTGKRLAIFAQATPKSPLQLRVFDIASPSKPKLIANEVTGPPLGMAFADDDHIVLATQAGVTWIDVTSIKTIQPIPGSSFAAQHSIIGVGGGHAVAAIGSELVISTPTENRFLGYALESPAVASAAPDARLMIGLGDTFALLDAKLAIDLGPTPQIAAGANVGQVRWLEGDDWVVEATTAAGPMSVTFVGAAGHKAQEVRAGEVVFQVIAYEPSTHLMSLSFGDHPEVDRYDPKQHKIEHVVVLAKSKGYEQTELVPLSPVLADGLQMVRVTMRDTLTLQWLKDPHAMDAVAETVTVLGSFAGADAAGHVYVWRNNPSGQLDLVVFRAGKQVGLLPYNGSVALWPDRNGERVLEVGQQTAALYKVDGTLVWNRPISGSTEAVWLTDGAIAIITAAGIARLDPTTGAITAARCGWKFGLSPKPHPSAPAIEPVCTQLGP